jgi:hypothetical protein
MYIEVCGQPRALGHTCIWARDYDSTYLMLGERSTNLRIEMGVVHPIQIHTLPFNSLFLMYGSEQPPGPYCSLETLCDTAQHIGND